MRLESASSAPARSIDDTARSTSARWTISWIGSRWTSTSNIERSIVSGFRPWLIVRLPCGSRSTASTFKPCSAKATARLGVVVVFATPPFWFAKAMTVGRRAPRACARRFERGSRRASPIGALFGSGYQSPSALKGRASLGLSGVREERDSRRSLGTHGCARARYARLGEEVGAALGSGPSERITRGSDLYPATPVRGAVA